MVSIVPVVEGPGEVQACPLLLRRILQERCGCYDINVAKPKNAHGRGSLLKKFESYLQYAAGESQCGAILVLLDADQDCAVALAGGLAARSRQVAVGKPVAIVCARREYEAWFIASLETVRGNSGISETAQYFGNVEDQANPKAWLTLQMHPGRAYKETLDQPRLTSHINLGLAHANSRSFQRLCHAVDELVLAMGNVAVTVTP